MPAGQASLDAIKAQVMQVRGQAEAGGVLMQVSPRGAGGIRLLGRGRATTGQKGQRQSSQRERLRSGPSSIG